MNVKLHSALETLVQHNATLGAPLDGARLAELQKVLAAPSVKLKDVEKAERIVDFLAPGLAHGKGVASFVEQIARTHKPLDVTEVKLLGHEVETLANALQNRDIQLTLLKVAKPVGIMAGLMVATSLTGSAALALLTVTFPFFLSVRATLLRDIQRD